MRSSGASALDCFVCNTGEIFNVETELCETCPTNVCNMILALPSYQAINAATALLCDAAAYNLGTIVSVS